MILRLQTELDTAQQQYTGVIEEMNIRDDEVSRLNIKIKAMQSELRDTASQLEIAQERVSHGEKTLGSRAEEYEVLLKWNVTS